MNRRLPNLLTALSLLAFVGAAALWAWSYEWSCCPATASSALVGEVGRGRRVDVLNADRYAARRAIETIGVVTVEKRGNVVADRIVCGGLIVRGKVKGAVDSRGPVLVGPEAEIKGNVTAPSLAVGAGAVLEGKYAIGKQPGASAAQEPERPIAEPD